MKMYYVYIIVNPKNGQIYMGYSSNLKQRMHTHQNTNHKGWQLAYYEAYRTEAEAREREIKLKHYGSAKGHLKKRIQRSIEETKKLTDI